jgi:hypothetical protein
VLVLKVRFPVHPRIHGTGPRADTPERLLLGTAIGRGIQAPSPWHAALARLLPIRSMDSYRGWSIQPFARPARGGWEPVATLERAPRRVLLPFNRAVTPTEQDALQEAIRLARAWIDRGKGGARPSPSSAAEVGVSERLE